MSRIEHVLDKARREGQLRHTAPLGAPAGDSPAPTLPARPESTLPTPRPEAPPRPAATPFVSPVVAPRRAVGARIDALGMAALQPRSAVAEQYRALRTRIAQAENDRYYRAIVVTSPCEGDGKSVTSLNLALAMAQEFHRRTLLIDGDLRSGTLHRLLGIPATPGLSDVLSGAVAAEDAILELTPQRLAVLPAGSPVDRPTEMLGSAEMRRLLDTLRTQFDRIVIDAPPAAPLADVGVLAPIADGVLLVVRAGRTPRPAIDRAIEDLDARRILGLVLNDVEEAPTAYRYSDAARLAAVPPAPSTRGALE
jgi:protein-tyrosine kinase